jgi:hypothetical protein
MLTARRTKQHSPFCRNVIRVSLNSASHRTVLGLPAATLSLGPPKHLRSPFCSCSAAKVPTPPRGHWQVNRSGEHARRIPLERGENDFELRFDFAASEQLSAILEEAKAQTEFVELEKRSNLGERRVKSRRARVKNNPNSEPKRPSGVNANVNAETNVEQRPSNANLDPTLPILTDLAAKNARIREIEALLDSVRAYLPSCEVLTGTILIRWLRTAEEHVNSLRPATSVLNFCERIRSGTADSDWWSRTCNQSVGSGMQSSDPSSAEVPDRR